MFFFVCASDVWTGDQGWVESEGVTQTTSLQNLGWLFLGRQNRPTFDPRLSRVARAPSFVRRMLLHEGLTSRKAVVGDGQAILVGETVKNHGRPWNQRPWSHSSSTWYNFLDCFGTREWHASLTTMQLALEKTMSIVTWLQMSTPHISESTNRQSLPWLAQVLEEQDVLVRNPASPPWVLEQPKLCFGLIQDGDEFLWFT